MNNNRIGPSLNASLALVRKRPGLAAFLFVLVLVQFLNFTGFCYRQARYYSDKEFILIAANIDLGRHGPNKERNKAYESAGDLVAQNPNCCHVYRWGHYFIEMPFVARAVGFYYAAVQVWYRIRDDGVEQFYDSHVIVNACGEIIEKRGIPERNPPRR
jgi:hypothetical protein